ncbi:hypothetical protein FW774_17265 [Pedobacter sp. BS3]|uniref:hypothetical protein n=1 Tax=Pedobacter sp. BS3 TaxID=2567937 RepID=UPI0011EC9D54|nr:hypothetical protein [Pedobacter sp. BS3]TZF81806.1 hypothetical protein FW774_17265 [Pedobacter sp. BS3]
MIRGSQTLTAIFPAAFTPDSSRKGKKSVFTAERDTCLAYRFYYYYHIARKRFDDAIAIMEKEFFIAGTTIIARLTENDALLKDIKQNNPDRAALRKRYPHFNW